VQTVAQRVLRFEGYTLDIPRGSVRNGAGELDLRPKSFEVLRYLVENHGRLVSKDELMSAIWPNVFVTQDSLTRCISDIRIALGDEQQRIIRTVPRRGYMLDVAVSEVDGNPAPIDAVNGTAAPAPIQKWRTRLTPGRWWLIGIAGAIAALAVIAIEVSRSREPGLPLPDRPSIAVLPFVNMGADPQQDYFSDGISEDLITSLSKFSELFVIARDSTFTYKGRPTDPKRVGRELGVRYLVQGSVRSDAERLRISAQLVEARTAKQLWANSYDREPGAVFALQDEVTQSIVRTLVSQLTQSELESALRKPPETLAAYDYYLRGNATMRSREGPDRVEKVAAARILYRQAMAIDPRYARAVQGLANTYMTAWLEPARNSLEWRQQSVIDLALSLARESVALDPYLPEAHATMAWVLHWSYRRSEAIAAFERAFELNPNLADGRFTLVLYQNGRAHEAIPVMKRIMRLDPFPPAVYLSYLGNAYYLLGEYEKSLELLKASAKRLPGYRPSFAWQAAAAAQLGRDAEARDAAAELLKFDPDFTIKWFLDAIRLVPRDAERLSVGLRKAGLPE
jgi:adenylate cyclase